MNSTRSEQVKRRICDELATRPLSVSHDQWHLERVLAFAEKLQAINGGDSEIITAAALLHDLGRTEANLHGRASVDKSIEAAGEILDKVGFPDSKIESVLLAIDEHDQPGLSPSTVEGRILKDADFLAGFGAWGIIRIAMWAGESGRGVSDVLERLGAQMPRRFRALDFAESVPVAASGVLYANLCLSLLKEPARLARAHGTGKYIVLEGISGSGKDTQCDRLRPQLQKLGHRVVKVTDPTIRFGAARDQWGEAAEDPVVQLFLLLADRYLVMRDQVRPALQRGDTVLGVRSFISMLVYQNQELYDTAAMAYMQHFVAVPDLVILYDVDAETAYERCSDREKWVLRCLGEHEKREALKMHRQRYLEVVRQLPTIDAVVIDASRSVGEVEARTWRAVQGLVS